MTDSDLTSPRIERCSNVAGWGVVARVAVEQAAACDAGHTLTQLVDGMLQVGMHPNVWEAQRREAEEEMGVLVLR